MTTKTNQAHEARALHYALSQLHNPEHHGWAHPTGDPFELRPGVCPGCARRVLQDMLSQRLSRNA